MDGEGPNAELERLREQVNQLRADNQRLSSTQNGGTMDNANESAAQPVRREQAIYLPRERRCPKFSGSMAMGSLCVEEWLEEAQSCIRSRHMSDLEKALFLYDHLEGEARNEIKYRPTTVKESPTEIIKVLNEVYGCSKSYVFWQQRFFDRKQQQNESLFEFSHALMELMERVKQSKSDAIVNSDIVLRDQFCENVHDHTLRRELKRLVRADGGLTLLDVRKEAIRWVDEGQSGRDRTRTSGRASETQYTSQCEATLAQTSELAELKDMVLKQQAQLDTLIKHLGQSSNRPQAVQSHRGSRFRRAPDGQPICFRCDKPGHIARYCQMTPPLSNHRSAPHAPPDNSATQSIAQTNAPTSQSGN